MYDKRHGSPAVYAPGSSISWRRRRRRHLSVVGSYQALATVFVFKSAAIGFPDFSDAWLGSARGLHICSAAA